MTKSPTTRKRGGTKFPICDGAFYDSMVARAVLPADKMAIKLMYLTALKMVDIQRLTSKNILIANDGAWIAWQRKIDGISIMVEIDPNETEEMAKFLRGQKKSDTYYFRRLEEIGQSAGYKSVTQMTIRHTRVADLLRQGASPLSVRQFAGCTIDALMRSMIDGNIVRESHPRTIEEQGITLKGASECTAEYCRVNGIIDLTSRSRNESAWKEIRKNAMERDGYKCQVCGGPGTMVHHISRYKASMDNSNENLTTMCSSCHHAIHWSNRKGILPIEMEG